MHNPQRKSEDYGAGATALRMIHSFWYALCYVIGVCINSIRGPATTQVYDGDSKDSVEVLRPSEDGEGIDFFVTAREIVYHTRYIRWWIPSTKHSVYEVRGSVSEQHRHLFDPRLFESVTYPILCTPLLRWTRYPHMYAIRAHLYRVSPRPNQLRY